MKKSRHVLCRLLVWDRRGNGENYPCVVKIRYLRFREAVGVLPYEYAHCFVQTRMYSTRFCIGDGYFLYSFMTVGEGALDLPESVAR